jgi:type II secretory pathway component PulJ
MKIYPASSPDAPRLRLAAGYVLLEIIIALTVFASVVTGLASA